MVGAIPLGEVGVLCHLAVRDECRGGGIGRDLSLWATAYLRSRGVKTVRLYSTDSAFGLYRSLGFEVVGRRFIYRSQGGSAVSQGAGSEVREMRMGDLAEVIGLDHWWCGFDRSAVIKATLARNPGSGLIVRNASLAMTGYATISPLRGVWRLGPLMAADESAARNLIAAARQRTAGMLEAACNSAPVHPAHALYEEFGFAAAPDRVMMELGAGIKPADSSYATTSYLAI